MLKNFKSKITKPIAVVLFLLFIQFTTILSVFIHYIQYGNVNSTDYHKYLIADIMLSVIWLLSSICVQFIKKEKYNRVQFFAISLETFLVASVIILFVFGTYTFN